MVDDYNLALDITKEFLQYAKANKIDDRFILVDLFRHSLCKVLCLTSSASCDIVENQEKESIEHIKKVVPIGYVTTATDKRRKALLEACVKVLDTTCRKVKGVKVNG